MIKENLKQLLKAFGPGALQSMNELKEDIDNLRKEINKQNTNH